MARSNGYQTPIGNAASADAKVKERISETSIWEMLFHGIKAYNYIDIGVKRGRLFCG